VPRITASTVPEHRAAQRRALLDAAHALLQETGEAPSMAQLAERTGLARSSVYEYFGSRHEVMAALVVDLLPRWIEQIRAAVRAAPTPADVIIAYVSTNVALVAEGSHAPGEALAALSPGRHTDDSADRMHAEINEPLVERLTELGVEAPDSVAERASALVYASVRMVGAGQTPDAVTRHLRVVMGVPVGATEPQAR
jgi:AcrR family transcriptional regulator